MSTIDIVIPVHSLSRPIARAVRSVLADRVDGASAVVVCHNIDAGEIRTRLGTVAEDPAVRILVLNDDTNSPAAPRNLGITRSSARYLGFLDSDDELQPGALAVLAAELSAKPDLVVGQMYVEGSGRALAPVPRLARFDRLDPVRDLLNYRTTLQGTLVRTAVLQNADCPKFDESFRVGEDIGIGLYVWNHASHIRYVSAPSGYYLHGDATDRVTQEQHSPGVLFSPVRSVVRLPALEALKRRKRQAIAVKLMRRHVLDFLIAQLRAGRSISEFLPEAAATLNELLQFAPGSRGFFQRREAQAIDAIRAEDAAGFERAMRAIDAASFRSKLIPANPLRTFAAEAFLMRGRRSRALTELLDEEAGDSSAGSAA
ncbi:glycosyltransferase family 2 protein [Leucobacter chromiireducens]|uniref:glycosyltransferase family 2 protein n=1 Tax=Leucobacter chromiireducens TaxID=283877 RepID=UPI003F7EE6C0